MAPSPSGAPVLPACCGATEVTNATEVKVEVVEQVQSTQRKEVELIPSDQALVDRQPALVAETASWARNF